MCDQARGIDPTSDKARDEFLDWMASGDPVKDRWDELDLVFSLERAYCYIDQLLERERV